MTDVDIKYLLSLADRMREKDFEWGTIDYFMLKRLVPEMLCHICKHGDKNDGICLTCFGESKFDD